MVLFHARLITQIPFVCIWLQIVGYLADYLISSLIVGIYLIKKNQNDFEINKIYLIHTLLSMFFFNFEITSISKKLYPFKDDVCRNLTQYNVQWAITKSK